MNNLTEYNKMVAALVTGGIEVTQALRAAELVCFAAEEKPTAPVAVPKAPKTYKYNFLTQREIAAKLDMHTKSFNIILRKCGYIERVMLDKNKVVAGENEMNYISTYILTEKGQKLGMTYCHVRYTDGTVAVNRFKWKGLIIEELQKLGVVA
jgi:hypothetical protein